MAKKILPKKTKTPPKRQHCFEDEEHRLLVNQIMQVLRTMNKAQLRFILLHGGDLPPVTNTFFLRRLDQLSRNTVLLSQEHQQHAANVVVLHPSH